MHNELFLVQLLVHQISHLKLKKESIEPENKSTKQKSKTWLLL